ncbi:aldehyde dehydrogenase family protein [Bacillus massiliglaciei]|uniref:aldehyde dehydrogenase family protein n=1 Tax=Bacillus massiliglaciei TaxID=1816693 RepID=UPI000ABE7A1B|nr:aldehyde dehydrogenase family protein [Bacillus massiliglaciei]
MKESVGEWKVYSPATGEEIARMQETAAEQVPFIYKEARKAQVSWAAFSIKKRLAFLKKLRLLMVERMEEMAEAISQDTGKVKTEALVADIMPVIEGIRHIEKTAEKNLARQKKATPLLMFGRKSYVDYMPRGAVLVISPWNYPLQLAMIPIVSALAAGNSVVAKPSEVTPYVGVYMERLFREAGFPKGTVQFAHGGKELGALLTNAKPDYIFFTGSVRTGKIIGELAAKELIPVTLELGGKDPMIIFKDANLERAANAAIWGGFTNSGQVCMSVERVYAERTIYLEFLKLIKEKTLSLRQGASVDDDIGSMTFPAQREIVSSHIRDALEKGAILETGKYPDQWKLDEKTLFLEPMILSGADHSMKAVTEETFGPVLPIIPFDTEEEAVNLANDSKYGLNSSVWTEDLAKADRVTKQLVTGAVNINDVLGTVANHELPFGGAKQSGIGRYHGENGLRIFCHEKAVMIHSGKGKTEIQWYPYKKKYDSFLSLFKNYFGRRTNWINLIKDYIKIRKM